MNKESNTSKIIKVNTLHICVPTFKENDHVIEFIKNLSKSFFENWILYLVNAFPEDNLNIKLKRLFPDLNEKLIYIKGKETEYWSASVNRGLKEIKKNNTEKDKFIIANVDSIFSPKLIGNLVSSQNKKKNSIVSCAIVNSRREIIRTGIIAKSWLLGFNHHIHLGESINKFKNKFVIVDFLPVSFVIFPSSILNKGFFIDEKFLPHYGADYAYTLFLNKKGYTPFIDFSSVVLNNEESTGLCIYKKKINIFKRFINLFNIKNPSALNHRFWFVIKYYPFYAKPTAIISYFLKSIFEALFGGYLIKKIKNFFDI